jgi:3'-phosphoadenosine 5'-phosphosulfate sulfotransferase (PAPS reductase)/FAD synthetase
MNPYKLTEPAQICFSGGRTSAYMLYQILDANDGLPMDAHIVFQNTGKEREETLAFIRECGLRWNVQIVWLEWAGFELPGRSRCQYRVVDFETASRNGEPFDALTTTLGYLPNPTLRLCTAYLKVKTGAAYMRDLGYGGWLNVMGIRADEPARVARMMSPGRDNSGGEPVIPLVADGITKRDIADFWKSQSFDLGLLNINGVAPEGNCDLCFLKGVHSIASQIRKEPERGRWWAEQERKVAAIRGDIGGTSLFRSDRPSYQTLIDRAASGGDLFGYDQQDALVDCMCGSDE